MPDGSQVYRPKVRFDASPTLWSFLTDDSFFTGVEGPLGSGKSVACCAKVMKYATQQAPNPRTGMRHTRWAIIRNTYPELRSTTINTWLWMFPEAHCGSIRYSHPIQHDIKIAPHGDPNSSTFCPGLSVEVLFLALDNPKDVKHLKSLDLTGAWVNEASEISEGVVDMLTGRVGRFPPQDDGGATWSGIIADTNAPDDQNWWHKYSSGGAPQMSVELHDGTTMDISWSFYRQPPSLLEVEPVGHEYFVSEPGFEEVEVPETQLIFSSSRWWWVNPASENLKYLRPGYYHQQVQNKDLGWIQRFMQAKRIYYVDGKAWVPEFSDQVMVRPLKFDPGLPLIGGIDVGGGALNPAAVVGQRGMMGDWRVLFEFPAFDVGIDRFSTALKLAFAEKFGDTPCKWYLDPAAATRDEVYETAVEMHLRTRGFDVTLAPTNDINIRRDSLANPMGRMIVINSKPIPGFMVDTGCSHLRAGLAGKWYRRRVQVAGQERYVAQPEKNEWSHVCDAASYMTLGGGEHALMTRAPTKPGQPGTFSAPVPLGGTVEVPMDFNPLGGGR